MQLALDKVTLPDGAQRQATVAATQPDGAARQDTQICGSPVHLLMCTNALFLQHVAVCLTSVLVNNPNLYFNIIVVGRVTEELDEQKLRRSLAPFANYSLSFRRFTPPADRLLPLNPRAHYTLDNWTRLWVEEFFAADVDRVLYLDADTVVVGNIGELWHAELNGALLGAVDIPGADHGVKFLGLRPDDGYFNSGVLLFNLRQWRESRAIDTLLDYVSAHPHEVSDTLDQDALNGCFYNRRKRLDYKWNAVWTFFQDPPPSGINRSELETVRREARIIHFNISVKPWSYFCKHPRKAEYDKYLRITEWRGFVPPDRTMVNRLRKSLSPFLPRRTKVMLKRLRMLAFQVFAPSRH